MSELRVGDVVRIVKIIAKDAGVTYFLQRIRSNPEEVPVQPRFYISARYGRRDEAEALAIALHDLGYTTTSQWIFRQQPQEYESATDDEVAGYAYQDWDDIRRADYFVCFSEPSDSSWGRGSRHVEAGIALERGMPWSVIGPRENVFHYLPHVTHFESVDDFLATVKEGF